MPLTVPANLDEIGPEWMTAALAQHHPEAVVDQVSVELRDDGTNRRARLGLTYTTGEGPATVFVKAADPAHKDLIRMTSGMFHEPRLFSSGVQLPLEHPLVYAAIADEDAYDFCLVMEDLSARGADPRDSLRPLSVEQAATGMRALGRLHGRFWASASWAIPSWAGSNRSWRSTVCSTRRCPRRWNASTPTKPRARCWN